MTLSVPRARLKGMKNSRIGEAILAGLIGAAIVAGLNMIALYLICY